MDGMTRMQNGIGGRLLSEQAPVTPQLLLRPDEAAKALAISPRSLWTRMDRGEIPCVRIGRSVRYDLADLQAWIEAQKKGRQAATEKSENVLDSQSSGARIEI